MPSTFTVLLSIFISRKQLDIFTCLFSSTHLMFKCETLLNVNCCSCTLQGLLLSRFETVCLMYYAFPSSIDLICVCETRLSLHAVSLGTLAFFEFVIFPLLYLVFCWAHKLPMINMQLMNTEEPKCYFIDGI